MMTNSNASDVFPSKDYDLGVVKPKTWRLYVYADVCGKCLGGDTEKHSRVRAGRLWSACTLNFVTSVGHSARRRISSAQIFRMLGIWILSTKLVHKFSGPYFWEIIKENEWISDVWKTFPRCARSVLKKLSRTMNGRDLTENGVFRWGTIRSHGTKHVWRKMSDVLKIPPRCAREKWVEAILRNMAIFKNKTYSEANVFKKLSCYDKLMWLIYTCHCFVIFWDGNIAVFSFLNEKSGSPISWLRCDSCFFGRR